MHNYKLSKRLEKLLPKIYKKDKKLYLQLIRKIDEISNSNNIESYKNLKHNLKGLKRVHLGHFVLIFSYDKTEKIIRFKDFNHHDKVYKL